MAIRTRSIIKAFFELLDTPTQDQFSDLMDSVWFKTENIDIHSVTYGIQTIAYAASVTWNIDAGGNAAITLAGNATLSSITNMKPGQSYLLIVKQDATGSRTLTLPAGSKVVYNGAGALTLTSTPNAIDILTCFYDGTYFYWLSNKAFTSKPNRKKK